MERFSFEQIAGPMSDAFFLVSREGVVLDANVAADSVCDVDRAALRGVPLATLVNESPEQVDQFLEQCARITSSVSATFHFWSGGVGRKLIEVRCEGADVTPGASGGEGRFVIRGRPRRESTQFSMLSQEVENLNREAVERDRLQEELMSEREWLAVTLRSIGDGVITVDHDQRITFMNRVGEAVTGWPLAEAVGRQFSEVFRIIHEQSREPAENPVDRVLRLGTITGFASPTILISRDGAERPIEDSAAPILDQEGEMLGVVIVFHDITQRRRTERALRQSEQRFRMMVESARDYAIITLDCDGGIVSWNSGARRLLGYTEEEALGRNVSLFFTAQEQQAGVPEQEIETALATGSAGDDRWHVRKDGSRFWASGRMMTLRDEHGAITGLVKIFQDRTQRRQTEEALRESEERFRFTADHAPVLIWIADAARRCTWFNAPWLEFTGRAMEQEIGDGWTAGVHPDDLDRCLHTRRTAFEARQPFTTEYRLRRHDGVYRCVLDKATPICIGGAFSGYIGSLMDITEIVEARESLARNREQLERLVEERTAALDLSHQRLRLSERMSALGTLSAGLGHDMGNLLLPVRARLESLERRGLAVRFHEDVEAIRTCISYLQRLTNGLRLFAMDPDEEAARSLDATELYEWWADVESLLRNALPRRVKLEHQFPEQLITLTVGRAAFTQIIFNLVQNAGRAVRDRDDAFVRVWAEAEVDAESNGDHVIIGVTDNGAGMDEETLHRCLEPFFTTRTREISTGLGLSLVHGLVSRARGTVDAESTQGAGTTFRIRLPAVVEPLGERTAPQPFAHIAVSLRDPRVRSYVKSVISLLPFELHDDGGPDQPEVKIWVTDAEQGIGVSIDSFLSESRQRRVIVFGQTDSEVIPDSPQVIRVPDELKPALVRDALYDLAKSLRQESRHS